jgi:uncharacterized membrane protein
MLVRNYRSAIAFLDASTTKEPAHQGRLLRRSESSLRQEADRLPARQRTRPASAASILDRHGFDVIQVDDGFERSVELGLTA